MCLTVALTFFSSLAEASNIRNVTHGSPGTILSIAESMTLLVANMLEGHGKLPAVGVVYRDLVLRVISPTTPLPANFEMFTCDPDSKSSMINTTAAEGKSFLLGGSC